MLHVHYHWLSCLNIDRQIALSQCLFKKYLSHVGIFWLIHWSTKQAYTNCSQDMVTNYDQKSPDFLAFVSPFSRTVFKLYSHALPYSFWSMAKTNAFLCFFFQICTFMKVALISGAKVSEGTTAFFLLNLFFSIFFFLYFTMEN